MKNYQQLVGKIAINIVINIIGAILVILLFLSNFMISSAITDISTILNNTEEAVIETTASLFFNI